MGGVTDKRRLDAARALAKCRRDGRRPAEGDMVQKLSVAVVLSVGWVSSLFCPYSPVDAIGWALYMAGSVPATMLLFEASDTIDRTDPMPFPGGTGWARGFLAVVGMVLLYGADRLVAFPPFSPHFYR